MRTLLTLSFFVTFSFFINAQIPNGSFEDWEMDGDYFQPVGWGITYGPQAHSGEKVTDAIDGEYALKFASENCFEGTTSPAAYVILVPDTIYNYLTLYLKTDSVDWALYTGFEIRVHENGYYDNPAGIFESFEYFDEYTVFNIPLNQTSKGIHFVSIRAYGYCGIGVCDLYYTGLTIDNVNFAFEPIPEPNHQPTQFNLPQQLTVFTNSKKGFKTSTRNSNSNQNPIKHSKSIIYPNPIQTSQPIHFKNIGEGTLTIFDSNGREISNHLINYDSKKLIDAPNQTGIYWIKFESKSGEIKTEKLVVF